MRKSILALIPTFVLGCGAPFSTGRPVDSAEARDSVYKVEVTLTVDITPLLPKPKEEKACSDDTKKESKKGKGKKKGKKSDRTKEDCTATEKKEEKGNKKRTFGSWVQLSDIQKARGVHFGEARDTEVELGWSGTAWVADRRGGNSFLMTAGHVCESRDYFEIDYIDWEVWEIKTAQLPIVKKEHKLISRDNVEIGPATVLGDEDLDEKTYAGNDLCLLGVHGNLGTPLPLGDEDPEYGSHAEVIGAPAGMWGGAVAVIADLKYSGRGNVWGGKIAEGLAFTGDVIGGNSGSAIMQDGKVVALLNLAGVRFNELTTGVPWESIKAFLRKTLHRDV